MSQEETTEQEGSFIIGKTYIHIPVYNKEGQLLKEERKEMSLVPPDEFILWVKKVCPTITVEEDQVRTLARRLTVFNKVVDTLAMLKLSIPNTTK